MAHTECPDCGTPLRGIKLTDATERMLGGKSRFSTPQLINRNNQLARDSNAAFQNRLVRQSTESVSLRE